MQINLLLVINCNQPVDNFDNVIYDIIKKHHLNLMRERNKEFFTQLDLKYKIEIK